MPVSKKPRNQKFSAGKKNVVRKWSGSRSQAKHNGMVKVMDMLEFATEAEVISTALTAQHAAAYNNVSA